MTHPPEDSPGAAFDRFPSALESAANETAKEPTGATVEGQVSNEAPIGHARAEEEPTAVDVSLESSEGLEGSIVGEGLGSLTRWFAEITAEDGPIVGGKAASLGEMYRNLADKGVRIPNGFATTAQAYGTFLDAPVSPEG